MDQAQITLEFIQQSNGFVLSNFQAVGTGLGIVLSTFLMWGLMTKNINEKIKSKADSKATDIRFKSIESDIKDVKDSAKEDRAIFLDAINELRKDLRLKKDKS